MSLIFGAGFLLELLPASPEATTSTTKLLRTMATVCASPDLQIDTTDRKVGLASTEQGSASTAPSVVIGDSLTSPAFVAKASAIA